MSIQFRNPSNQHLLNLSNEGLIEDNKIVFPFKKGAYKIVEDNNYTKNFGYQWNKFATTQVDKVSSLNMSHVRFVAETGWDKEDLTGKNILEVGSGAGRFSQIILDYTKGNLYSVDYSNAVEANYKNNGPNDRLYLFQASIYELPFMKSQFDKVICLGVLQHTPNFEKSVKCLIEMAKPGAEVIVDFYSVNGWWTKLHAKYLFRPFTRKMSHEKLYKKIDSNIDWLINTYYFFCKIKMDKWLNRFLPICDINSTLPPGLPRNQLRELCVLDTFDMYSPQFDNPQKINTIINWFKKYGMENVWGGKIYYENCYAAVVKGIKK
jgi:2-polyprenyl-3-methyl-5-hydroxy-6-metoxy-1,4-benzoquinol methylase